MQQRPVIIELTGAPCGKGRPRFVRSTGHAYTPEKTRDYETRLRFAAIDAMLGRARLDGPLVVDVVAFMPIPGSWPKRKQAEAEAGRLFPIVAPDADNLLKVLDAFNEIVWADDRQITDGHVRKRYSRAPRLWVEVRPSQ